MKVAFAVPETTCSAVAPPLGLCYIAAVVRARFPTFEIKIFDGSVESNVLGKIAKFGPDVLAVSATTPQAPEAYKLLSTIKKHTPQTFTVIGGPHASALPSEATLYADTVVVGEGENAMVTLLNNLLFGKPNPSVMEGVCVDDLDILPDPAFDLIDLQKYINQEIGWVPLLDKALPLMRMVTQRGCPGRCPFCHNSKRRTSVRYLSAEKIISQIQNLVEKYGVRSVWFHDDEFLVNKVRLRLFVDLLKETGLSKKIVWSCAGRVSSVDSETLQMIRSAGCVSIFLGIESGCQRSLDYLKNGTVKVAEAEGALLLCKRVGLPVVGSFIVGCPDETLAEMQQTLGWIKKQHREGKLAMVGLNVLTPYPGTVLWDKVDLQLPVDYCRLRWNVPLVEAVHVHSGVSDLEFTEFMKESSRVVWWINSTYKLGYARTIFSKSFVRKVLKI